MALIDRMVANYSTILDEYEERLMTEFVNNDCCVFSARMLRLLAQDTFYVLGKMGSYCEYYDMICSIALKLSNDTYVIIPRDSDRFIPSITLVWINYCTNYKSEGCVYQPTEATHGFRDQLETWVRDTWWHAYVKDKNTINTDSTNVQNLQLLLWASWITY